MGRPKVEIPIGTRYGRGITVGPTYVADSRSYVDLRCDCGTLYTSSTRVLRREFTRSCGCLARDLSRARLLGKPSLNNMGEDGFTYKSAWLRKEKDKPCMDCGQRFPNVCMQFDHVPERGPKLFGVDKTATRARRTFTEIQAERAKCDLVCANCHCIRTNNRALSKAGIDA